MEPATEITLKNRVRAKKIAQGLMDGMTYTAISKQIGLSRNQVHSIMRNEGVRDLIIAEITERETTLKTWIEELHDTGSPANMRHAVSEEGKMIRHAKDKSFPSLFRTENTTVTVDLTRHLQNEQLLQEVIGRMPPTMRQLFKQLWTEVGQEYNY